MGQLLRGGLLILALVVYIDAAQIRVWLTPPEPQEQELGLDAAPAAAGPVAGAGAELR